MTAPTPKALADLLEGRAREAHGWAREALRCPEVDYPDCDQGACVASREAVDYLRQPDLVIARLALTVTNRGLRMTMPADDLKEGRNMNDPRLLGSLVTAWRPPIGSDAYENIRQFHALLLARGETAGVMRSSGMWLDVEADRPLEDNERRIRDLLGGRTP